MRYNIKLSGNIRNNNYIVDVSFIGGENHRPAARHIVLHRVHLV
jgi:hypothetical protein